MNKGKCLFFHCPVNRDVFEMEDVKDSPSPRNVGCRDDRTQTGSIFWDASGNSDP